MIIETYANRLYLGHTCHRWTVHEKIIIGGSIFDAADALHLKNDFGVGSVLNVETEHSDEGKGIECLAECRVPDNGTRFPPGLIRHAVSFAQVYHGLGPVYVHCQQGGSRSPAFAYAILRWVFNYTPVDALLAIQDGKPPHSSTYGNHPFHAAYLASVESALAV